MIVGRVRKAHGVRGDVVIEPITDDPDAVFAPGRRLFAGTTTGDAVAGPRELHLVSASPFKGGYIVHFEEIADRTAADTWRDRFILAPAAELEPLGEHEVYVHDLIGMRVELTSGAPVGAVIAIYELPQGLTLEVQRAHGTVLVPYERIVTEVRRDERLIRIDPPAGLLDD